MTSLKILTTNLWLLPPPTSFDNQKRLTRFIKLVQKLDPDIINLQEVWLNQYLSTLKQSLKHYHLTAPKSMVYNHSGLVTLTKKRPLNWRFHRFPITKDFSPIERVARKGFLKIQLAHSGHLLTVINTHIYQSEKERKLAIKLHQINEVVKTARRHHPSLIAGDLNTLPENMPSFPKHFLVEPDLPLTYSDGNRYAHQAVNLIINKEGVYNSHPDRVFAYAKSPKASLQTKVITSPLLSDHYPVLATLTLPNGKHLKSSLSRSKHLASKPFSLARKILPF